MGDQTADMLERVLRRNHSGNWPLVMPSDLLALVEAYRRKDQRIADLERERALLLRFAKAYRDYATARAMVDIDDEPIFLGTKAAYDERDAAYSALIDAGLLGRDDTEAARQEAGE